MKNVLISLFAFVIFSCEHNIPIANLEFIRIEKNSKYESDYFLYFSSDIELNENLSKEHNGARLKCFFKTANITDENFKDYNKYILKSIDKIEMTSVFSNKKVNNYKTTISFKKYKKDGDSDFLKEHEISEILKLINKKTNCLSCVVTAVTFMNTTKRYISNTMCLPKNELKKAMEK